MPPKNLLTFSFASPAATGVIDGDEVSVTVPITTDVTLLVATFTHNGTSVAVAGVTQTTGVTPNDFTDPVTYTVVASDLTTHDYTITVTVSRVTPLQIAQLRRMVGEPLTTTYSDALLTTYIEKYPHLDANGETQFDEDGVVNEDWIPTYDLNASAADIWEEKATTKIEKFDFAADGGNFNQSQQYEQMMKQARYYRSRRMPSTVRLEKYPKEWTIASEEGWIGNLPESD